MKHYKVTHSLITRFDFNIAAENKEEASRIAMEYADKNTDALISTEDFEETVTETNCVGEVLNG